MRDEFLKAYHAGDAATLAASFDQNAVQLPPNEPAVLGREAIRRRYQAQFDRFECELAATTEELEVTGYWSFAWGFYKIKLTPKDGGSTLQDNGKYLAVFRRDDNGSWKFARDMFSSDNPPVGSPQ
jgi:ketosteroid isomerase-like protein